MLNEVFRLSWSFSMSGMHFNPSISSEVGVTGVTGISLDLYQSKSMYPYFDLLLEAPATAYDEAVKNLCCIDERSAIVPLARCFVRVRNSVSERCIKKS